MNKLLPFILFLVLSPSLFSDTKLDGQGNPISHIHLTADLEAFIESADDPTATTELGLDADLPTLSLPASVAISSFAATFLDDVDEATFKSTLNLEAGTDFYSVSGADAQFAPLAVTTTAFNSNFADDANHDTAQELFEILDDLPLGGTVDTSGTPALNDFARFTDANTLEGRSYAEVLADLSLDADLQTIDLPASVTITSYLATVLDDANEASVKATLNLEAGTDYYSVSGADAAFQAADADLDTWAGISPGANLQTWLNTSTLANLNTLMGTSIADGAHTTDTTLELAGAETITGNWVNTSNPWADNEVSDTLTLGPGSVVSGDIGAGFLDASGFSGNLGTADDTFQEVAQKFNDFTSGSPGPDSIGTSELDDGAHTPNSGDYIRIDTVDQAGFEPRSPDEVLTDINASEMGIWPKQQISAASTTITSSHFGKLLVLDASSNAVSLEVNTGLAADAIFYVYVIDATNQVSIDGTATINDTTVIPATNLNNIITVFHTHVTDTFKIIGNEPMVDYISGIIAEPSDKTYLLSVNIPVGGTITETTTKSASGTCTANFKIDTTALGGTANSVSSTEDVQSHASANVFSAGDDINLTVSGNSSTADLSFTIKYEFYP